MTIKELKEALNKCTSKQQDFFVRIYGEIDLIKSDKFDEAYSIIQRTLKKNLKLETRK